MAAPFIPLSPGIAMYAAPFPQPNSLQECLKNSVDVRQTLTAFRITVQTQKESWLQCVDFSGKILYVNNKTKILTEEKPDIFKTPEELLWSTCPWKEFVENGKVYYRNKKSGEVVEEQPEVYKLVLKRIQQMKETKEGKPQKTEGRSKRDEMIEMLKEIGVQCNWTWEETKKKMKTIDGMKKKEVRGIFNEYIGKLKEEDKNKMEREKKEKKKRCEGKLNELMEAQIITVEMKWEEVNDVLKGIEECAGLNEKEIVEIWRTLVATEEKRGLEKWTKVIAENETIQGGLRIEEFCKECDGMKIPGHYQEKLYQFYLREVERKNEDKKRKEREEEKIKKQLEADIKDILFGMSEKKELMYGDTPDYFLERTKNINLEESVKLKLFEKEQSFLKESYLNVLGVVKEILSSNMGFITPNMSVNTFIKFYSLFDRRPSRLPRNYLSLALQELCTSSPKDLKRPPPQLNPSDLPLEKKKLN